VQTTELRRWQTVLADYLLQRTPLLIFQILANLLATAANASTFRTCVNAPDRDKGKGCERGSP